MPIPPKHRLGEDQNPQQFIDREDHIETFTQVLSELPLKDNKIINYYGVGGIGKTALRKELCNLLKEKHSRVIYAVVDFNLPSNRDAENALFSIRRDLHQNYKIQFPSFDLAYAVYWETVHPQTTLKKDKPFLLKESELFADLVSLFGDIPVIQILPKIINVTSQGYGKFNEWWVKRGIPELRQLPEMEPFEMMEWLPAFFGKDLEDYIEDKNSSVILFFDTYEALWGDKRGEGLFSTDEWVRELASNLPGVLWVISGREKLRWQEVDSAWENHIEPYLIGGLSDTDASSFLISCGIEEEAIRETIVNGSEGVPFYLGLQVDTYLQIKKNREKPPSPEDFAKRPHQVITQFIRYPVPAETETIKILSVARFWDRELFGLMIKQFNTGYPLTALPQLCRFSFVQEVQIPESWTFHPLMREGLAELLSADDRQEVHQVLFDYYCQLLESLEQNNITEVHRVSFIEAFYHGQKTLETQKFFEWFNGIYWIFIQAAEWQFLTLMQEECTNFIEERLGPNHPDTATSLNNLGSLYRKLGLYHEAEPLLKRALDIREKMGTEHTDTATSLDNLALLYDAQGRYTDAEPLYKRALDIDEKVSGPEHPNTATSLDNLAKLYVAEGRYPEAEPLYKHALDIREKVPGPEHPDTAISLNNLAALYYAQGCYTDAEVLYKRALDIYEKVLGPEHPDTAASLNNLALLLYVQGRKPEAEPLLKRALDIREKMGTEHPDTATSLDNLAELYLDQGRYPEAEPLLKRALDIREKILGPEHPDTATSLNNLASFYYYQGRYPEAEALYKYALDIREKMGTEHPDTATSLNNLALLYYVQGRKPEAALLYKRALDIREKILGPEHPDTTRISEVLKSLEQEGHSP